MDLLAKRYGNPYLILDDFIRLHQLHDFVYEILKKMSEEKIHEARWQFYLHKVFDMSFEEYVQKCENLSQETHQMTDNEFNEVVSGSKSMLDGFMPE